MALALDIHCGLVTCRTPQHPAAPLLTRFLHEPQGKRGRGQWAYPTPRFATPLRPYRGVHRGSYYPGVQGSVGSIFQTTHFKHGIYLSQRLKDLREESIGSRNLPSRAVAERRRSRGRRRPRLRPSADEPDPRGGTDYQITKHGRRSLK